MPLIDGPDCRLWVDVHGEGEPVTLVAHGITSSSEEIAAFVWQTPGTRILFDFRGHGRSESPPEAAGYDTAAMRRDLEFVADRYDATQALGVSMGSSATLHLLADSPDRFDRLLFFIPSRIDQNTEVSKHTYPALAHMLETMPLEEVADTVVNAPESQPLIERRPAWRELMRARILRMNATGVPRALRAFATGLPPCSDATVLKRVLAPTLILAHEDDPIHPSAVARRLGELLPNAEVRIWDKPLEMLDDFSGFTKTVAGFLGGSSS
ncbi:MAG: alpha/beta fold hydrolase [Actinomycetota bacterium]